MIGAPQTFGKEAKTVKYYQNYAIKSKKELVEFIKNRQLEGYKLLHTAKSSGYISRLVTAYITEYSGRFGVGYVIHRPRRDTSGYHDVQYLVKSKYDQNSNVKSKYDQNSNKRGV